MDGHFRAFSFVDQITELQPGVSVRGRYTIPKAVDGFPASLVAEAVGQLAAWAAMAEVDFTHRPVAGIAGTVELLSAVCPGQVLELAANLESVDQEAVGYSGSARADGVPVVRLVNCLGPMVLLEEFDDPQALRDRFALLTATGAIPGAFRGVPVPNLEGIELAADSARAMLKVPEGVPFFADHFPRRPVFPGTLLLHAKLELASRLATTWPEGSWRPQSLSEVKLRSFIAPAETLELYACQITRSATSATLKIESRINKRLVSSAQITFTRDGHS